MKIVGMMLVRNSEWILPYTLGVAMRWCDEIVVLDHKSTDRTPEIVRAAGDSVTYLESGASQDEWPEMELRERLLRAAIDRDATHVAIIDDDEALTAMAMATVRQQAGNLGRHEALVFPMVSPYGSLSRVRVDSHFGGARISVVFPACSDLHYASLGWEKYQHHSREPKPFEWQRVGGNGGCVHFQFVVRRRLIAKAVWYKMRELLRWPHRKSGAELDRQYDWTLREDASDLCDFPLGRYVPDVGLINLLAEPWQEAEARRWIRDHPDVASQIKTHGLQPA